MTGEFALGTNTFCVDYQDCYNLVSTSIHLKPLKFRSKLTETSCPTTFICPSSQTMDDALANITTDGDRDTFLREFWESQFHAYEQGAGWIFW